MSIRLMSAVWDLKLSTFEKLVMLALADCANDEGECWPSIATLCRKTGAGERTVQRSINSLILQGMLKRIIIVGKGNRYWLDPRHSGTPATKSPPPETTLTPATVAPKPSREPSSIVSKRARVKIDVPDWLPVDAWEGFLEMRKDAGKMPTARAMNLLIAKLDRLRADGNDPGKVLDQSTERNWLGIFEVKANGQRNGQNIRNGGASPDRRSGLARAIDDGIEHLDAQLAAIRH